MWYLYSKLRAFLERKSQPKKAKRGCSLSIYIYVYSTNIDLIRTIK